MWMPISRCAAGELADRERVVDLGRRRVVDRERAHRRDRQLGQRRQRIPRRKRGALRKRLGQEAIEVIVVRRRNRAARAEQVERADPLGVHSGVERLPFGRALVGPVQQHVELRPRAPSGSVRARSSADHCAISRASRSLRATDASAAFSASGGAAIAAAALPIEIHRRARQRERDGGGFGRRGDCAVVFARELVEAELVVDRYFPQEIRVDAGDDLAAPSPSSPPATARQSAAARATP